MRMRKPSIILMFVGASLVVGYIWLGGWIGAVVCSPIGAIAGVVAEMVVNAVVEKKSAGSPPQREAVDDGLQDLFEKDDIYTDPSYCFLPGNIWNDPCD